MTALSPNLAELFGKLDLLPHLYELEHFFSRAQNTLLFEMVDDGFKGDTF